MAAPQPEPARGQWELLFDAPRSAWQCFGAALYAVGEGGPLLLVLGTDGLGPGQPLDLYAFDLAARRWHRVDAGGRAPQPESVGAAACAVLADRLLCLWSCRTGIDALRYAFSPWQCPPPGPGLTLSALDFATMRWQTHQPGGPAPPMRQDFSCAVAGEGVAVLFGGVTAGGTLTAAAVLLDADALQWRPLAVTGEPPRPCRGHSACVVHPPSLPGLEGPLPPGSAVMFVFGGHDAGRQFCATLHALALPHRHWLAFAPGGLPPSPRGWHAMAALDGCVAVHGGADALGPQEDLYLLDPAALAWRRWPPRGARPPARSHHAMVPFAGGLLVFGGRAAGGEEALGLYDAWHYRPSAPIAPRLPPVAPASVPTPATPTSPLRPAAASSASPLSPVASSGPPQVPEAALCSVAAGQAAVGVEVYRPLCGALWPGVDPSPRDTRTPNGLALPTPPAEPVTLSVADWRHSRPPASVMVPPDPSPVPTPAPRSGTPNQTGPPPPNSARSRSPDLRDDTLAPAILDELQGLRLQCQQALERSEELQGALEHCTGRLGQRQEALAEVILTQLQEIRGPPEASRLENCIHQVRQLEERVQQLSQRLRESAASPPAPMGRPCLPVGPPLPAEGPRQAPSAAPAIAVSPLTTTPLFSDVLRSKPPSEATVPVSLSAVGSGPSPSSSSSAARAGPRCPPAAPPAPRPTAALAEAVRHSWASAMQEEELRWRRRAVEQRWAPEAIAAYERFWQQLQAVDTIGMVDGRAAASASTSRLAAGPPHEDPPLPSAPRPPPAPPPRHSTPPSARRMSGSPADAPPPPSTLYAAPHRVGLPPPPWAGPRPSTPGRGQWTSDPPH